MDIFVQLAANMPSRNPHAGRPTAFPAPTPSPFFERNRPALVAAAVGAAVPAGVALVHHIRRRRAAAAAPFAIPAAALLPAVGPPGAFVAHAFGLEGERIRTTGGGFKKQRKKARAKPKAKAKPKRKAKPKAKAKPKRKRK